LTDQDFLDRANITVFKGEIKNIDTQKKEISLKGVSGKIPFDKLLVAWGSFKKRLNKDYSNVFYLEDRYAHAKCHNDILKANKIVVFGSTMDAYQVASSMREYLNSIGYNKTEVIILHEGKSEIAKNMGDTVSSAIEDMLRKQGVCVIEAESVYQIKGEYKVDEIHFRRRTQGNGDPLGTRYFIKPDVVVVEDGVGAPR